MNNATLQAFRDIADAMGAGKTKTWAIVHDGGLMFGYTRQEAERVCRYYQGGHAVPESAILKKTWTKCYCSSLGIGQCDFCSGIRK